MAIWGKVKQTRVRAHNTSASAQSPALLMVIAPNTPAPLTLSKGWTLPPKTQTGLIFLNWVWCAIFWAVTRINLVEVPGDPVGVSKVQVGREGGSSKEGLRLPSHLRRRD